MSTTTPPLPVSKATYLRGGIERVDGWLNRSTATYLSALEVLQRDLPVEGDVCEIGVHHGKSFLCLALGLPEHQRAVAIDVFEEQQLNVDASGRGDRARLERNLAGAGAGDNVEVVGASSLDLESTGFVAAGRRFRLFSIDGGHTPELTLNDLRVAERTVVDAGIVALDDVLNPHWLGVVTGLFRYWAEGGTLVPAVFAPGKLLLTTDTESARRYRHLLRRHFDAGCTKRGVPCGEHTVDVYGEFPWVIRDERGGRGLQAGAAALAPKGAALTRAVPTAYLADLEQRAQDLQQRNGELRRRVEELERRVAAYEAPLHRRLVVAARRRAGRVRRRVTGRRRGSR